MSTDDTPPPPVLDSQDYRLPFPPRRERPPITPFPFVPVGGGGAILRTIQRVMAAIAAVPRRQEAIIDGKKRMFRGIDDMLNALHGACAEHGLLILPQVREIARSERETRTGGRACDLSVKIDYLLVAAEDGSSIEVPFVADATNIGDKAIYVAYSMGMKYLLTLVFLVPTEDLAEGDAEAPVEVVARVPAVEDRGPSGIDLTDLKAALAGAASLDELKTIGTEIAANSALTDADRTALRWVAAGRKSWLVQQQQPGPPRTAAQAKAALAAQMASKAADALRNGTTPAPPVDDLAAQMGVE